MSESTDKKQTISICDADKVTSGISCLEDYKHNIEVEHARKIFGDVFNLFEHPYVYDFSDVRDELVKLQKKYGVE